jgi:hypothetical protein
MANGGETNLQSSKYHFFMTPHSPDEELLRADLFAAQQSMDAVRDAIASNQVTKDEAALIYKGALNRYASALRRFSALVVHGRGL